MTEPSAIRWRPWGPAAFDEAQRLDKPIVLRLSAVWCHWCHVMDETSDRVPEAITLLNEQYVPIRVDIDKMPDVRERYNFGGFPSSAFLTPQGDILTGGTYIPPDQWVHLLRNVHSTYQGQKDQLLAKIREHERHHVQEAPSVPGHAAAAALRAILDHVIDSVRRLFDPDHGGFGKQPKFPQAAAVELALRTHLQTDEKTDATVVQRTLECMRRSALWDTEEGGFFRYSVTREWTEPHYEKMLETNAGLLSNYARAAGVLGRPDFLEVADDIRAYLHRVLRDPATGLFYGSQDASESYYRMTRAERAQRDAPFVDRTHYTNWNAEMVCAYLDAFVGSGDDGWLKDARRTLDALLRLAYRDGEGLRHYGADGTAHGGGVFADHAWGILALVRAFELTSHAEYLRIAEALADHVQSTYWDDAMGAFRDRAAGPQDLGLLRRPQSSIIENGVLARALVRLARHRAKGPFSDRFLRLVAGHERTFKRYGMFAADLAIACQEWLAAPLTVNLIADTQTLRPWLAEAQQIPVPGAIVRILDARAGEAAAREQGIQAVRPPALFFCSGNACSRLYRPGERFLPDLQRMVRATPRSS